MMVSTPFLTVLVTLAWLATLLAPVLLLYLFMKDRNQGQLW